jgi:hypothetical protein
MFPATSSNVNSSPIATVQSVLLTTLSPQPTYSLFSTFQPQSIPSDNNSSKYSQNAKLLAVLLLDTEECNKTHKNAANSRYYLLYSVFSSITFREFEQNRADYDSEPILSINFNVLPSCHCLHPLATTARTTEIITGFNSGAILIYNPFQELLNSYDNVGGGNNNNPISGADIRLNTGAEITNSKCTAIQYLPHSPTHNLFITAHHDGHIYCFDKTMKGLKKITEGGQNKEKNHNSKEKIKSPPKNSPSAVNAARISINAVFSMYYQNEPAANPQFDIEFTDKSAITDMKFSPNNKFLAITQQSGLLTLLQYRDSDPFFTVYCSFRSYYGGFITAQWSFDSNLLVAASEDDLLNVFDVAKQCLLARCEGHHSWPSHIEFSPAVCTEEFILYKFHSSGQDCQLLFWEYKYDRTAGKLEGNGGNSSVEATERIITGKIIPTPPSSAVKYVSPLAKNRIHSRPLAHSATTFSTGLTIPMNNEQKINEFLSSPAQILATPSKSPHSVLQQHELQSSPISLADTNISILQTPVKTPSRTTLRQQESKEAAENNQLDYLMTVCDGGEVRIWSTASASSTANRHGTNQLTPIVSQTPSQITG